MFGAAPPTAMHRSPIAPVSRTTGTVLPYAVEVAHMPSETPLTLSLRRFSALLAALRDGPLNRHALLERLGDAYPRTASARPMVDRDVKRLAELGIVIAISHTRPPIYTLRGGVPSFDAA